jgi:hypothetical protein
LGGYADDIAMHRAPGVAISQSIQSSAEFLKGIGRKCGTMAAFAIARRWAFVYILDLHNVVLGRAT